ncbi:hypothetical protein GCM10027445_52080 [Amycolatopsis endophytica]|uniref:Uncharacterized protein n=1 Tax=Amycolatopsis endophytica TaxID=860233 RepID=A0A853B8P6_9PSEU|nr:hypothetical protein [Amycolatopsis endophytica]
MNAARNPAKIGVVAGFPRRGLEEMAARWRPIEPGPGRRSRCSRSSPNCDERAAVVTALALNDYLTGLTCAAPGRPESST